MTDDATQQADTYEFLKAQKDAILAKKEADENEWLKAAAEDITHYKQERDLALAECERLKTALEIERMRLAGCGVAAMQNTEASKAERITKDNPYWSASYGDVCRAVDAEIEARENYLGACETIAKMHAAAVGEITGPIRGVVEDVVDVKLNLDLSLAECERLRADVKNLIRGYINTLESCRDRILMLGGKCDSLKTMELSDPHLRAARKALRGIKDRESHAFEDWLEETCPSGDVESVQWQWENSEAYKTFLENNND